ncbi:O-methyltransferase [soil metagenome]
MSTFLSTPVQSLLQRLHAEARAVDPTFFKIMQDLPEAEKKTMDYKQHYGLARDCFLPVGEDLGRLLYSLVRSSGARTIVEFGTSFGISTIYLAAALRDNGGGRLITCEFEPSKSQRAKGHLAEAGLDDLVDFRVGDALELLNGTLTEPVDFVLLDGAKPLYLPVLKLIEPRLKSGALVASDNINDRSDVKAFTDYVRDPAHGYLSVALPLGDGIELSVRL